MLKEEISERELSRIEEARRHREMLETLRAAVQRPPESATKEELMAILKRNSEVIEQFMKQLADYFRDEEDVAPLIDKLESTLLRGMKTLKDGIDRIGPSANEWVFKVNRDRHGFIENITAIKK